MKKILSLDVSAASTGWCLMRADGNYEFGTIKTKPKFPLSERLTQFREELKSLLNTYEPDEVVIEDAFSGINVKTLKILCKFAGVAEQCCFEITEKAPTIMSNHTVKSYFKVSNKEELFNFIIGILELNLNFKKDNDKTDAYAQALCFLDSLGITAFRIEKDYGYEYKT